MTVSYNKRHFDQGRTGVSEDEGEEKLTFPEEGLEC